MKTKIVIILVLFIASATMNPGIYLTTASSLPVPFETVDQGEISFYRYGDSGFDVADVLGRAHLRYEAPAIPS